MRLLLLGATGAVGGACLDELRGAPDAVVAPTRRALLAVPNLHNPLDPQGRWEAPGIWQADAVLCALGSTIRKAGSPAAFHAIDHDLVLALLQRARAAGTPTAVLVSSLGASAKGNFYLRTKHAAEQAVSALGFASLSILRPSMIDTEREESRPAERLGLIAMRALAPLIPARYRAVSARRIARCMLACARSAAPGIHLVESDAIQRLGQ